MDLDFFTTTPPLPEEEETTTTTTPPLPEEKKTKTTKKSAFEKFLDKYGWEIVLGILGCFVLAVFVYSCRKGTGYLCYELWADIFYGILNILSGIFSGIFKFFSNLTSFNI